MHNKHQLMQEVFQAELEEINKRKFLDSDGNLINRHEQELGLPDLCDGAELDHEVPL